MLPRIYNRSITTLNHRLHFQPRCSIRFYSATTTTQHGKQTPFTPIFSSFQGGGGTNMDDNLPIRVPFLPSNDAYARRQRSSIVPTVAPPHKPVIAVVSEDSNVVVANSALAEVVTDDVVDSAQLVLESAMKDNVLAEVKMKTSRDTKGV